MCHQVVSPTLGETSQVMTHSEMGARSQELIRLMRRRKRSRMESYDIAGIPVPRNMYRSQVICRNSVGILTLQDGRLHARPRNCGNILPHFYGRIPGICQH